MWKIVFLVHEVCMCNEDVNKGRPLQNLFTNEDNLLLEGAQYPKGFIVECAFKLIQFTPSARVA